MYMCIYKDLMPLSIDVSIYLFVYPSIRLFIYLSIYQSVAIYLSIYPSVYLSIHLSMSDAELDVVVTSSRALAKYPVMQGQQVAGLVGFVVLQGVCCRDTLPAEKCVRGGRCWGNEVWL